MGGTLLDVLPLAVAIALSPFPVVPAILLLFTPTARRGGSAFLAGWASGVAAGTLVFAALADLLDPQDGPPTWASWTRIGLGAALVVLGVRKWLGRGDAAEQPGWMRTIAGASPAAAYRLGVVLSAANPKVLILTAGAGIAIGAAHPAPAEILAVVAAFTLVASLTVATPVVLYLVAGDRVLPPLRTAKDWLERNNAAVMAVVLFVIGGVLVTKGIGELVG